MRAPKVFLSALAIAVLLPSLAFAQKASLTGVVRDTSGAILPGVTVEATSPVLIEKVRSAVTDGSGQYRIIDLDPGTYQVTFSLPGFTKVVRAGVEISGAAVVTISADLRVGALEETITVTGETPVVDVQSVRRETVLSQDIIATIPATRTVGSLLNATPGLTVDNNGLNPTPTMTFFSARGGQTNEGRMTVNGLTVAAAFNGGGVSSYILDTVNSDEVSVTVSGGMGESDTGGPVMNLVPRAGGNSFRGQAFYNNAGDWSRGDNITDDLRAVGITETPGIIKAYDTSVSYGGPIKRDRLWFFGSVRGLNTETAVEGVVANANAGNLSRWDWVRDASLPARQTQGRRMYIGRATAQVTSKHRVNFSHEYQTRCEGAPLNRETDNGCHKRGDNWIASAGTTTSPESATAYIDFPYYLTQVLWTAPITNKILFEAGYSRLSYDHAGGPGQLPPDGIFDISVTEQSATANPAVGYTSPVPRTNYTYRALAQYQDNWSNPNHWRASASYVTGSHNMKVGYQGSLLINQTNRKRNPTLLNYNFNQGNPVSFGVAIPEWETADTTEVAGLFVQDTWTRNRLTLQGALRWDRAWSWSPADGNGTKAVSAVNAAPIRFDKLMSVDAYIDITPRFGAAYDLFGNGKTALKFNMGHYLDAATNDSAYTRNNPANRIVSAIPSGLGQPSRGWTDSDNDKVVDCDLLVLTANGECAALTGNNLNFGNASSGLTRVNPDTLHGWGVRENDWQWGVTVQQELRPRLSLEVGYARRWFRGVTLTDNQARTPDQYDSYVLTAPTDSRLPGGGGYPIRVYQASNAALATPASNYITFQTDFGPEETNYWHGVDLTVNARTRWGMTFSGGTSTGRSVQDDCATQVRIDSPDPRDCHDADPFQTTFRGFSSYTIPKIDVLISGTFRSQPEVERIANYNLPNTTASTACAPNPAECVTLQGLLGRLPTGQTAGGTQTINLIDNDHRLFSGDRRTQIDVRIAKVVRFRSTRADVGVDLTNLLNTNYATAWDNTYQYSIGNTAQGGTWNNPTTIYAPRFVRLNLTLSF
ncbi:MAG TPA: TonB-dependent receptor [Vicinamibacterales bacterium]|nr:TonB-dependent receptor [Vicinamibacterales bacterium]